MEKLPNMKDLLEAGSHFGHEAKRWNPKMKPFIFTNRDGIHVIDLEKTEEKLKEAVDFIKDQVAKGGEVVFLATKKQAQEFTKEQASRVGAMYLTSRWVGGLFTNFETVKKTLSRFEEQNNLVANPKESRLTKKELMLIRRHLDKVESVLGGVKTMSKLPEVIFIVDSKKELNAVLEARKMGVKIVAICDTNSDPTLVDYPIPANDDAIKSIQLIVRTIADSVEEGKNIAQKKVTEVVEVAKEIVEDAKEDSKAAEKAEKKPKAKKEAEEKVDAKEEKKEEKKTTKKTTKATKEVK